MTAEGPGNRNSDPDYSAIVLCNLVTGQPEASASNLVCTPSWTRGLEQTLHTSSESQRELTTRPCRTEEHQKLAGTCEPRDATTT